MFGGVHFERCCRGSVLVLVFIGAGTVCTQTTLRTYQGRCTCAHIGA